MATEDGAVLAGCVAADDLSTSLERDENLRKDLITRIQQVSRRNARIFHISGISGPETVERNRTATQSRGQTNEWLFSYHAFTADTA